MFEGSEESEGVEGLGLLEGKIVRIPDTYGLKIPHIGWNSLHLQNNGRLFQNVPMDAYVYFVHSYYLQAKHEEIVKSNYGIWSHYSCICGAGQHLCLPVPPGEEQLCWTEDT